MQTGKALLTVVVVVLSLGLVLILVPNIRDMLKMLSGPDRPVLTEDEKCLQNLAQIGKEMRLYSEDHEGRLPLGLSEFSNMPSRYFLCPASRNSPGMMSNVEVWTSYIYLPNVTMGASNVVAYCDVTNHDGKGGAVLFADGHVAWFDSRTFKEVISSLPVSFQGVRSTNSTPSSAGQ